MCQQKILEKFKNFSKNFVEYGNKACYGTLTLSKLKNLQKRLNSRFFSVKLLK